jgi:hypothetical protein
VQVAKGATVEISPMAAQWPEDLDSSTLPESIDASKPFVLDGN